MADLSLTASETMNLRETVVRAAVKSFSFVDNIKISEVRDRFQVVADFPVVFTISRPQQFNAVTLAKGTQFTGYQAVQSDAHESVVDTRVGNIRYPTDNPSYDQGGPGLTIRVVGAEGNRINDTTAPGFGKGIIVANLTHAFSTNPKPRSNTQKNP